MNIDASIALIEHFTAAKSGEANSNEDRFFITTAFAGLIDGSRGISGFLAPGRFQMALDELIERLEHWPVDISAADAALDLSRTLREHKYSTDPVAVTHGGALVFCIYSAFRNEIWRVGDAKFAVDGEESSNPNPTELILSAVRAMMLEANQTSFSSAAFSTEHIDAALATCLTAQLHFMNSDSPEYGFGAINGGDKDLRYLEVLPVPADAEEIVFATDGYPQVHADLDSSERALHAMIALDPLCIRELKGPKGVERGNVSFDDRTYLRFHIQRK